MAHARVEGGTRMIASLRGYGRIARAVLVAIAGLLILGIAGSLFMAFRAKADATEQVVAQAWSIADGSLTLAFTPQDLEVPVTPERAAELTRQIEGIVVDPSDFEDVTVFSTEGEILYSTQESLISSDMPAERDRIREALRGTAQTRHDDGAIAVLLPLRLRSGVGETAAVELSRPDDIVNAAPGPWRTNALLLVAMLVLLLVVTWIVGRVLTVGRDEVVSARAPQPATRPVRTPATATAMSSATPGLREESEARRRAEERAIAAEERLTLLQGQYRKSLDDVRALERAGADPIGVDARLEDRALRAEGRSQTLEQQVATLTAERERLATDLRLASELRPDREQEDRLRLAEREASGLRAELNGANEALGMTRRELDALRAQVARAGGIQAELDATHVDLLQAKDALRSTQAEVAASRSELDDARTEVLALRAEERRAAMLDEELRSMRAELASIRASHRAELVEREAELEEKVRATREEFQRQLQSIETSFKGQVEQREAELAVRIAKAELTAREATRELETVRSELAAAEAEAAGRAHRVLENAEELTDRRSEIAALQAEIKERTLAVAQARKEADDLRHAMVGLNADLAGHSSSADRLETDLSAAKARAQEAIDALTAADRDRAELSDRVEKLNTMLEAATAENAEANRRLQDSEARRQLELASDEGRTEIDDLLRVTQERLAGQTEKLIAAEDRARDLEAQVLTMNEQLEVVQGELRHHQMSDALREIRTPEVTETTAESGEAPQGSAVEDRRATTPFLKELSIDAKKSMARINGIAQLLKHKKDAKDQAQLVKQLAAYARRLNATVNDLTDAEGLVRGTVELQVRKTDLGSLVQRVVEESGISSEHEINVAIEPVTIRVDPQRAEQILLSLLRGADDRTTRSITVRLQHVEGGGLISVEDGEPSSDASMSPVVKRFAEVLGGWAKVESSEGGGSSFRVFLPDAAAPEKAERADGAVTPALQIVVDEPGQQETWDPSAEQILSQELRRLAEQESAQPQSRRSRR